MKILKELIRVVNKNKIKSIEVLDNDASVNSIVNAFYNAIHEGEIGTNEEAQKRFAENNSTYRNLKKRLKRRLLNTLFFIDVNQPQYNDYQKSYYQTWKNFTAAKILIGKYAHSSSEELLLRVIQEGIKYGFPTLVKESARELRRFYGTIKIDSKKMDYYNEMYDTYEKIEHAEAKTEKYYINLVSSSLKKNKSVLNEIHIKSKEYFDEIKHFLTTYDTNRLHLCGRLIELIIYMSNKEHQNVIDVCEKAITFFESKSTALKNSVEIFVHRQLTSYIVLKDFENGKIAAEKGLKLSTSYNWFLNQKFYFLLCTHSKEYQEAYTTLSKVQTHELYKRLPEHLSESWRVYEAYTHYLIAIGQISANGGKKYRIGKFLNEVPAFSKDKKGMNIPVLIIQVLFLIHQGKTDAAIDRIESLQSYGSRNIRKDENFRTNCFIKMLAQLPKAGFRAKRLLRHADKYHAKLLTMPIHEADQAFEIEVIPYEDLWGLVVESLG